MIDNSIFRFQHIIDGLSNQITNANLRNDLYDAGYLGAIKKEVEELAEKYLSDSELNAADVQSIKYAGFETVGEIISAYSVLQSRLQAAESKLEEMAQAEPYEWRQLNGNYSTQDPVVAERWKKKGTPHIALYLHADVPQSNADKVEIDKLKEVIRNIANIASPYSRSVDSISEDGGEDTDDPIERIHWICYHTNY